MVCIPLADSFCGLAQEHCGEKNIVNSLEECKVTEGKHDILMREANCVQHDVLCERYAGKLQTPLKKALVRGLKAGLGCRFRILYYEVNICFTVNGYVYYQCVCLGTYSGVLNGIELRVVQG